MTRKEGARRGSLCISGLVDGDGGQAILRLGLGWSPIWKCTCELEGKQVIASHGCKSFLESQGAERECKAGSKVLAGEQSGVVAVKGMCGELGI